MRAWSSRFLMTGIGLLVASMLVLVTMSLTGLSVDDGWAVNLLALITYIAGWLFLPLLLIGGLLRLASGLPSLCPRGRAPS
jgi:hypothetical protein